MDTKKTKTVYRRDIAAKLKLMGHEVIGILPNPKKPEFDMWLFKIDDTFYDDFNKLIGGKRYGID